MGSFRTIRSEFRHEIEKIKGSRFIGILTPVQDSDAALAALQRIREEFADARHHCWAWRLGADRDRFRFGDDGEPSGSAGRPILQALDGQELTDILAVVVRYFGGTKLGVGGLIRAYGGCAAETIGQAPIEVQRITETLRVQYGYELSNAVDATLAAYPEATLLDSDYGEVVTMTVAVPSEDSARFTAELNERSAGRIRVS